MRKEGKARGERCTHRGDEKGRKGKRRKALKEERFKTISSISGFYRYREVLSESDWKVTHNYQIPVFSH